MNGCILLTISPKTCLNASMVVITTSNTTSSHTGAHFWRKLAIPTRSLNIINAYTKHVHDMACIDVYLHTNNTLFDFFFLHTRLYNNIPPLLVVSAIYVHTSFLNLPFFTFLFILSIRPMAGPCLIDTSFSLLPVPFYCSQSLLH